MRDSINSKNSNTYDNARANSSLAMYQQNNGADPNNPSSASAMAARQYDDI